MPSYLKISRDYGGTIDLYERSMSNAVKLADGSLPMLVVMQKPCNLADEESFEITMYGDPLSKEWSQRRIGCPALQEVEMLIHDTSHGHTIWTTYRCLTSTLCYHETFRRT